MMDGNGRWGGVVVVVWRKVEKLCFERRGRAMVVDSLFFFSSPFFLLLLSSF